MSLVSDALRKARLEAAARDRAAASLIGGGLPPMRRSSRLATGLVLGVLLALAAVLGGGAVAWWLAADRDPQGVDPRRAGARAPVEAASSIPVDSRAEAALSPPAAGDSPDDLVGAAAGVVLEPSTPADDGVAGAEGPSASAATGERGRVPVSAPSRPPRQQEYLVVADLGDRILTLDYLVHRATDPFAQVNGVEVHVGSTVAGFTVEEITEDAVHLRDELGSLVLRAR